MNEQASSRAGEAAGDARPLGFPAGSVPRFVGRTRECALILAALGEAVGGRGRLLLLSGEPGIGKTRLCDEATAAATSRGIPVVWGRCWEAGGAPAYWPWGEPLGTLVRGMKDAALGEVLGEGAPLLAMVVPALRGRVAPTAGVLPPAPDEARFLLWRAVAALLRQAAAPAGLVLVLEDLHAADEPSLLLLLHIARELRGMRVLVLATFRDVEARFEPAVGDLVARIGREGVAVPLPRLAREDTATLLRHRVGDAAEAVEAAIFASTQGNPLFVEEMARLLGEAGAEAVLAGDVPDGVREAIRQRLARVPDGARPVLDLAAAAGDQIDVMLLAEACDENAADVEAALLVAIRAGVVAERGGERRFSHALVREVLYRDLSAEARRSLHGKIAGALERLGSIRGTLPLAELAHHLLAGPAAGLARAVDVAIKAADGALASLAYEEAIALLVRVAEALAAARNPPRLRAQVLLALGNARIRGGETEAGKRLCCEVATLARGLQDPELLARAALTYGLVFTFAVVDPVLVGLLEEALELLPAGDSPLRARLLGRLGAALTPAAHCAEPVRVAREAIATARRLGDPRTLLDTMFAAISALMDIIDPHERQSLNLEVEQLASKFGEREWVLRTQGRLVVDTMEMGDLAAADLRIEAYERLARDLKAPWYLWRAPVFRSMRAMMHGRFAEAEALLAEAEQIAGPAWEDQVERCLGLHRHALLRAAERHAELRAYEPTLRRAIAGVSHGHSWQVMASAFTFARIEDLEQSRLHLALRSEDSMPSVDNVFAAFYTAESVALVGSHTLAERLLDILWPFAAYDVMLGFTQISWEGPVTRLIALLLTRLERWEEADVQFAAAVARCRRLDARPYLARTEYEWARALLIRGRAEDKARAGALLESAHGLAAQLGLEGLQALIEARRAEVAMAPVPAPSLTKTMVVPTPGDVVPFTMTAEGEIWALAHAGVVFRLKDSLGLQYLARLFGAPGREIHVLDLVGTRGAGDAVDGGDAGELLDDEARETYRRRLEDLRDTLAEAESFGDSARVSRTQEEIDFLAAELGRAVGLGGRVRRAGGAAERARSAVQRRIKNALSRIDEQDPELGKYLARTVRTGNFCVFRPSSEG
ncbi:MAG TPA: AAA family ATPase [Polyangia bacterium]